MSAESADNILEAIHLTRRYGSEMALFDANFTVHRGEAVGLLGPNGAGKSTTMNLLCGYLEPSWGQVRIAGIDMAERPLDARRHIGYLPEVPPLYLDMTVEEQLAFACDLRGLRLKRAAKRDYILELCRRTQIQDIRGRLLRNLSKGYRQRVAVTQLLAGEPELLVLDEPTVGLDPRQIHEFRDLLGDLGREHTILLSSHILSEISSICDRILVFSEGLLVADGQPEQLQARLSGYRELLAELRGDPAGITEALSDIPGVLKVEAEPETVSNVRLYRIAYALETPGEIVREKVFETAKSNGFALLLLRPEEVSLESLYLKLTEEGTSEA